jgi:hypothetical protein
LPTPLPTPMPTPAAPCRGTYLPECCCIDDLDCDEYSFCLYSSNGPLHNGICAAFAQLGENCEENSLPHLFHQCAPLLECVHLLPGQTGICRTPYVG